ncbi:MAG: lipopolysaccharide biosynthesis protein, partial [Pseudomonadota bacterium]|nr:lipopolysaccharide biosynthesis protein [Pseudomonadota bacterium]
MFWRGVWGYLPVQAVQAVVGFGAIIAFTRLLTPEQYGHYALAYSVGSLIHTSFITWLESAMARFQVAEAERGDPAAHLGTLHRTWVAMVALIALVAAPIILLLPLDPALKLAIGAAMASFSIKGLFKLIQERKRAEGDVKGFALMDIALSAGSFGLGMVLAWLGWGGASPLAAVGFVVVFVLIWTAPGEVRKAARGRFDAQRLRRYAAYGLPMSLSLILALALSTTDRFIIAGFLGEESVGAYHAGYSVGFRMLDVVFIWLGLAGAPAAVAALERGGPKALAEAAQQQAELMALIAIPAVAGLALVAGPLVEVLVGEQLRAEAAQVTPWIALGAFFYGVSTYYFHQAFTLGRRTGLLLLAMAAPAVANIGLNLWLVPAYGIIGAAWSTAASFALGTLASALLGRRAIALPVPWAAIARCALAAGVMAAAVRSTPASGGWSELFLKAAVGAGVYAAA